MKIGIVTFWNTHNNYGQILQCYALQEVLRNNGHDPYLIRYDQLDRDIPEESTQKSPLYRRFFSKILYSFKSLLIWKEKRHNRSFDEFVDKFIKRTKIYSLKEIRKEHLSFDLYITGSDQIWSCDWPFLFLDFCPKDSKKIAYAASFGGVNFDEKSFSRIKNWIKDYSHISVREESGILTCDKLGYKGSVCLPDPTLLLSSEDYEKLFTSSSKTMTLKDKYVLVYWLGNETNFSYKTIKTFAKKRNLRIVYITAQGNLDLRKQLYPSIEEWLFLIKNATYVITNSFHGTVFSVLFEKKFIVVPLTGAHARMNSRIETFLNDYSLGNRIYSDKIEAIEQDIDYINVLIGINAKKDSSINLLNKWIDN